MNFEWDERKNKENVRKHGLDFAEAWEVFTGPMFLDLDLRTGYGEDRWVVGFLGNRVVVVIFTTRYGETIRIVSLRKALRHERKKFREEIGY